MSMYASDYTLSELMCACIAREIEDGDLVILGSFTPLAYAAYILAKMTHAPNMCYVGYSAVDARPFRMSFTTSEAAATRGAAALWSMTECINSIHCTGRGDVEAVSGAQVDKNGSINISVIGPYDKPVVRLPGGAGAPEVIKMHRKMIGYFPSHNNRTLVEKVDFITGTRYLISKEEREAAGLRPGPIRFITNLAVMSLEERDKPFVVESLHPGVTAEEVRKNTGFELRIPDNVPITEVPTVEQVTLLREQIDPFGTREFDMKSGKERMQYLEELLKREWELVG
ncbi:MAG: CoA-transferase subunit beta [Chloroflexota bacterium]|nr:MAG: CoA-transferase subunit beta [Chloroflexota bacterium]